MTPEVGPMYAGAPISDAHEVGIRTRVGVKIEVWARVRVRVGREPSLGLAGARVRARVRGSRLGNRRG